MSGRGINEMPGRPEGEATYRVEEQELQEAAHRHELDEELHAHEVRRTGFFSKLFRRRRAAK
jgi:hypothetical protein